MICGSPRLILREYLESDAESLLNFLGDPEVMRFSLTGPKTLDEIRDQHLPNCWKRYARDGVGQWAVTRKSDGVCIGECGICVQEVEGEREYEIGYRLRRDCWGSGLATEAAQACRDHGFDMLGLRRLISIIEADNTASIRVAEKVGMRPEKKASFHGRSVIVFSVTRSGSS